MPTSTTETLLNQLRSELGRDLRLVAKYDPDSLDPLYVRDDIKSTRSQEDYEVLHSTVIEDHQKRTELEKSLGGGPLHASLLAFEDVLGANFLGKEQQGHVTTLEADADVDLKRYLQRFEITTRTVRRFDTITFEHTAAGQSCPHCSSPQTISTPEAGPSAPYYCLHCDRSFS